MVSAPPAFRWPELGATEGRVLLELLLRGAQSRTRIADNLGLSRTGLTRAARSLVVPPVSAQHGSRCALP